MTRQTAAHRRSVRSGSATLAERLDGGGGVALSGDAVRRIPTVRPRRHGWSNDVRASDGPCDNGRCRRGTRNWQ
ncbi:hypothetical protein [Haloterrigena salinisoli]|uniref:hypothetical protein n=1 Tax=Haloterrigena salinisoli TaxID=3132747 RepID=UPI0030CE5491